MVVLTGPFRARNAPPNEAASKCKLLSNLYPYAWYENRWTDGDRKRTFVLTHYSRVSFPAEDAIRYFLPPPHPSGHDST